MGLLEETLESIKAGDSKARAKSKLKWDSLLKPLGSLGRLEEIGIKISGMTGKVENKIEKKAIVVMVADNGILEEGVSASPLEFTTLLTEGMVKGVTGVATLAKFAQAQIVTVDLGLNSEFTHEKLIDKKIAYGTKNFCKEQAMTYEEAIKSIEIGIEIGDKLFEESYDILGTGELGMGNTTTSSAILSVLSGLEPELTCGVGGGATQEQMEIKIDAVKRGIELHKPNREDPIDVIAKIGGFDIGGMCGLFLSGAKNRKPIVMDGFISSAAALCAIRLNPLVKEYIISSHLSHEPAANLMFEELGLESMLDLKMRLGEGSGCPLAFQIIESALFAQSNMGTLEEARIDSSILLDMRENNKR